MTDALFNIRFSDGADYFHFYVRSDASPEDIIPLIKEFCEKSDDDTHKNDGRLNWDYMSTSLMLFIMKRYEHKDIHENNLIKIVEPRVVHESSKRVCYTYDITVDADKYRSTAYTLFEAMEIDY